MCWPVRNKLVPGLNSCHIGKLYFLCMCVRVQISFPVSCNNRHLFLYFLCFTQLTEQLKHLQEYTQDMTTPISNLVTGFFELDSRVNQLESLTNRAKHSIEESRANSDSSKYPVDSLKSLVPAHDTKLADLTMVCHSQIQWVVRTVLIACVAFPLRNSWGQMLVYLLDLKIRYISQRAFSL